MARKRKPESLLLRADAPFGGALVTTRGKGGVKLLAGSTSPVYIQPAYWTWHKGIPLIFVTTSQRLTARRVVVVAG